MRLFRLLIIPFLLTLGYLLLLSYPYFFSKINRFDSLGFLSVIEEKSGDLQKTFSPERRTDQFDNHLLKGEKITSKVKASENNLGILLFRFAKLSGKVSDTVVFRIKKEGEENWYYENNYKADQFQPDQYFTFGFPPIINSKNNTYVFEIESLAGTYQNGIGVSLNEPIAAFVYKYTRDDLKNYDTLSSFVSKKLAYVAGNVNFLQNWLLFAIFVLSLIFVIFMEKKKINISNLGRFLPPMQLKLSRIPLVITIIFFAVQSLILLNQFGVFSVVEETSLDFKKTNQQDVHLLKNQKAVAAFKASENNLGIVLIRLVKFGQGGDQVVFRIKKEGEDLPAGRQGKWYHESKFHGDQVKNNQYFPLGFPPIADSKNNIYVVELESLAGDYSSGIGVIKDGPSAAIYRYSVEELKDYRTLLSFTYKKIFYVLKNINYWQVAAVFVVSSFLTLLLKKKKSAATNAIRFLLDLEEKSRASFKVLINKIKSNYLSFEKKIVNFVKIINLWFTSTAIYLRFLNTNTKKRLVIGLLIFLLALTYRFSSSLGDQSSLFYAGLGGQGDYDQFIRTATCAVTTFCSAILGQNFLIEASILGIFYKIFGFTGALKAYLYLMIILSSIVATLPHFLLSRKSWITLGGLIGSIFLATSDFLTKVALNFPPDNGSLFTFSIFYVVYLLTFHIGTIRWLLFFGLMGTIDGLNKALFLINNLAAFILFIPVFFYEKVKETSGSIFRKKNIKMLFLSSVPLLVFLIIYIGWEYFVYTKFSAYYFLRGLIESRGVSYVSYTSLNEGSSGGNIIVQLVYLCVSAIVMIKRLVEYTDLKIIFLAPIFLGLLFFTFVKPPFDKLRVRGFPVKKFIVAFFLSVALITLLTFIKNDYFKIHEIFAGEYISGTWIDQTYIEIFLLSQIILLFILNFKYRVIKLALPIIPYVIMLIILTKNSPFPRISTQVVAWIIILLAFLVDWIMISFGKYSKKGVTFAFGLLVLILFVSLYMVPKTITMITQLNSGFIESQNEVRYLKWVEESLPANAVILAGGKSDLVTVAENIKRPIIYSTLWNAALLIRPKEIPGVSPSDFSIVSELKNKDNFKKNKYVILEDDIYVWRSRITGTADNLFSTTPGTLHAEDYSLKVFKFNPTLKKAIYELNLR